jgi:hypothetical protein
VKILNYKTYIINHVHSVLLSQQKKSEYIFDNIRVHLSQIQITRQIMNGNYDDYLNRDFNLKTSLMLLEALMKNVECRKIQPLLIYTIV